MTEYIYDVIVRDKNGEDKCIGTFEDFDEAKDFALQNTAGDPYIAEAEANRDDYDESTLSNPHVVWAWDEYNFGDETKVSGATEDAEPHFPEEDEYLPQREKQMIDADDWENYFNDEDLEGFYPPEESDDYSFDDAMCDLGECPEVEIPDEDEVEETNVGFGPKIDSTDTEIKELFDVNADLSNFGGSGNNVSVLSTGLGESAEDDDIEEQDLSELFDINLDAHEFGGHNNDVSVL